MQELIVPMQITSPDGRVLRIHTEVGEGVTRVIVEEVQREPVDMEADEEQGS